MEEGTRLHKEHQLSQSENYLNSSTIYKKEVSIKEIINYKNISFEIKGRVDGVLLCENKLTIEEIKSTSRNLDTLSFDDNKCYMSQALIYGYFLSKDSIVDDLIQIDIVYIKRFDESKKTFSKEYTKNELLNFFLDTIESYYKFAKIDMDNKEQMVVTGKAVPFPYDSYRTSQREFMSAVYSSIVNKNKLFAEAPTGVGKTLSTVFPSIKALSNELGKKIFYLTAKSMTKKICLESLYMLEKDGLKIVALIINSKENMCLNDTINCDSSLCSMAKGHFDRINDVIYNILVNEKIISEDILKKYAKENKVCPYYLQLSLIDFSHIVICDYNYVYNPTVALSYFDKEKNDFIVLVDEAHNLEARSRDFFSSSIKKSDFKFLEKNIDNNVIKNLCKKITTNIDAFFSGNESYKSEKMPTAFVKSILDLRFIMDSFLGENKLNKEFEQKILEIYFLIDNFLKTSVYYDKKYRTLYEKTFNDYEITLFCIDTSTRFFKVNALCRNTVFFSATFTPINYFSDLFGGDKEDFYISLDTPFDSKNQLVIIDDKISTYYKDRQNSYKTIAQKIYLFTSLKVGNYFVFFPSYEFLENVLLEFNKINFSEEIIVKPQLKNMTYDEKESFLESFEENNPNTVVGFLVLGGSFSEGVNLTGQRLIGAIIIGVGISKMNFKNDVILDYYEDKIQKGYEFAYMYSGMNKVLQAGGRVIRTENDLGVIMFIDTRFTKNDYKNLFPKHLRNFSKITDDTNLKKTITSFWDKNNDK